MPLNDIHHVDEVVLLDRLVGHDGVFGVCLRATGIVGKDVLNEKVVVSEWRRQLTVPLVVN